MANISRNCYFISTDKPMLGITGNKMKKKKVILITTMLVPLNRCMTFIGYKSDDDGDHHGHHHQEQ